MVITMVSPKFQFLPETGSERRTPSVSMVPVAVRLEAGTKPSTPFSSSMNRPRPDSRTITIQPWDRGAFAGVEKAILKSDLGLTPVNDGKIIRISIPPLTEDRRKELGKLARKSGEEAKVAVRNVRRDANDQLKKLEKDKAISEDELKKATDDVQKLTDKYVAKVDEKCAAKEKEIMDL